MESEDRSDGQIEAGDNQGPPALAEATQTGSQLSASTPIDREPQELHTTPSTPRDNAQIISQYGLLLCNIAVLLFLWLQLQHFSKQTAILQSQLINGQRAWVTLKQADHTQIGEGERVGIKLVFTNSGNSPALNLTINSNAQFRSISLPTPMPLADESAPQDRSRAVMTPHGDFLNIKTTDEILTRQQLADIENRRRRLYAWGRIEYDDIFGQHHRTEYCLFSQPGTLSFTGCENHNTVN